MEQTYRFLLLLVLADLCFISLHLTHNYLGSPSSPFFSLEKDGGHGEAFQYIKLFWSVVLLLLLALRRNTFLYLAWSLVFFYLLADDALELHERIGASLSQYFVLGPASGLRAQDFGELLASLSFGVPLLVLVGIAHWWADQASKGHSTYLFMALASLAFFGIVVDMIHVLVSDDGWYAVFTLLEDGGEMLIVSVAAWLTYDPNAGGLASRERHEQHVAS